MDRGVKKTDRMVPRSMPPACGDPDKFARSIWQWLRRFLFGMGFRTATGAPSRYDEFPTHFLTEDAHETFRSQRARFPVRAPDRRLNHGNP
jgi:hypothetical protein